MAQKLSVIAKDAGKTLADLKKADPDGHDLRTNNVDQRPYYSALDGKLTDSEINNYFFLPALGNYHNGSLEDRFLGFLLVVQCPLRRSEDGIQPVLQLRFRDVGTHRSRPRVCSAAFQVVSPIVLF